MKKHCVGAEDEMNKIYFLPFRKSLVRKADVKINHCNTVINFITE